MPPKRVAARVRRSASIDWDVFGASTLPRYPLTSPRPLQPLARHGAAFWRNVRAVAATTALPMMSTDADLRLFFINPFVQIGRADGGEGIQQAGGVGVGEDQSAVGLADKVFGDGVVEE